MPAETHSNASWPFASARLCSADLLSNHQAGCTEKARSFQQIVLLTTTEDIAHQMLLVVYSELPNSPKQPWDWIACIPSIAA